MPHTIDEAALRRLLADGVSQREIARRLGIPRTTLQDYLKRQGLAVPRPPAPVQRPVQSVDTGAVGEEVQGLRHLIRAVIERLDELPVSTPVQITALPPFPPGKTVRWNLWIHAAIRDEIAALAAQRGILPSQLVQEMLWRALNEVR
jgi:hypothetical protein